ncbi:MAG: tRNA pseudouridine(38-40) synthase TruA [Armatimonadota bacterium]|nr:tRNA pseudouridine(38-40) synthase TruA [Armatimonadota bacterium]MDR7454003.1 tRNA pseudouridine(38-40) synthase TruA [Armatimonadota bacterium]MDR7456876.1 tRNA pseudouridine(38-40) synthase TruA [Armatimonadota bacterium]MDR7495607.1 tRNA pseudouridine(38-40) synthase TruA [Armatimonadota bacterium]
MPRLAVVLEYDGTAYAGWQRQPRAPSVQAAVEAALGRLVRADVRVVGAGRTDAGVHALGQVAHADLVWPHAPAKVCDALNALLPADIRARQAVEVPADFHARRDARLRVYRYALLVRPRPSALLARYAHHVPGPLDLERMRAGAARLLGVHDFAAFRAAGTRTATTRCHVRALAVEPRGALVVVTVAADRFLRQMVRRVVGGLLRLGRGALGPDELAAVLASRDPAQGPPPAPAHGLYLARVLYPPARLREGGGGEPVL